ncbi:MAG: hypothetical protein GDA43_05275 [Hormoscilla sp. SP5CHS1]|nr:hypothetical protein [Hormoscilla sp. SP5CHS1]MBO1348331.1 hypothetical protein [Hormoscilla sp. GUM202]
MGDRSRLDPDSKHFSALIRLTSAGQWPIALTGYTGEMFSHCRRKSGFYRKLGFLFKQIEIPTSTGLSGPAEKSELS